MNYCSKCQCPKPIQDTIIGYTGQICKCTDSEVDQLRVEIDKLKSDIRDEKRDYNFLMNEYKVLDAELRLARAENEKLMNVEYWPERCKQAEKEQDQLRAEFSERMKEDISNGPIGTIIVKNLTKERDLLKVEVEMLKLNQHIDMIANTKSLYSGTAIMEENARLTKALEFYAVKRLYTNVGIQSDLYDDAGKRAREALKLSGEEK